MLGNGKNIARKETSQPIYPLVQVHTTKVNGMSMGIGLVLVLTGPKELHKYPTDLFKKQGNLYTNQRAKKP